MTHKINAFATGYDTQDYRVEDPVVATDRERKSSEAHNMVTLYVTYSGNTDTPFNRDYWIDSHLPLVRECWEPHGLISVAGCFPSGEGKGLIAIAPCVFRDEAAMRAALASPEGERVMADVAHFTSIEPSRSRAVPL